MRVIIILAAIAFTHGAKLERTYLPPSSAGSAGGSGNFLQAPLSSGISGKSLSNYPETPFSQSGNSYNENDFSQSGNDFSQSGNDYSQSGNGLNYNFGNQGRPERPRAALERNAAILRLDNSNDGETYSYAYETENGITAEESGVATNGVEGQGGYSYTGDDGQVYSVRYTADQNGFVPQGDHLPTPPPVPEEILKALEKNARDEAAGIYDDGSYNEGKYSEAENNGYNYQQNNAYNSNNDDTIVTNSALARSGNARSYVPPTYNAPAANAATYNAPAVNAAVYNAPSANAASYNAPAANAGLAPTYGAPAQNAPTFDTARTIAPTYGAPAFSGNRNVPSFTTATASNTPTFNARIAGAKNSATEKAYLPPSADQRGQTRNAFGRRQQSFDARTGYNY